METTNLLQNSPEWHAYRAQKFNASDAPAMMGVSKYKTREQLLHERATGFLPDVNAAVQNRFNDGHRFEALARPLAEKLIGADLYPVTGYLENYSASFDGITMDETIIFEHKTLNDELRLTELIGKNLPTMYRVQMEQQLMISGAEKCFFMASKWDGDGVLIEAVDTWYYPDLKLRQSIIDAWAQFEIDLESYVPPVIVEKIEAETIQALPVPSVVVRGEITASNLTEITPLFDKYLGEIKSELSTDQDFADAEANAKNCRETATRIKSLRTNIIAQMVDVNAVDSILANYEEVFNKVGLRLEKAVKEQKESIKTNAILATKQAYFEHIKALEAEIAPIRLNVAVSDFAGAIKGIKSIGSMHSRLNDALASGKIEADASARDIRTKLVWYNNYTDYKFLFSDLQSIISKPLDDFMLLVESRVESHKQAELAKEAKIKSDAETALMAKQEAQKLAPVLTVEKPSGLPESMQAKFVNIFTAPTQYFAGVTPSVNEIVSALAMAFRVNEVQAHQYLIEADFSKWNQN